MNRVAMVRWKWSVEGPLVTGYSQSMAQASGLIERGERTVVNLRARSAPDKLEPAFLSTSVKGVFRTAGAWLIERVAREALGVKRYVTCDYGRSVPDKWARLRPRSQPALCPACQVFGGAGCLSAEGEGAPHLRLKSPVSFGFADGADAFYGEVRKDGPFRFAWEQAEGTGQPLKVERLVQPEGGVALVARVEGAEDAYLALLLLAGDLIGSGFFRFGRFTTRGYGTVRLSPLAYLDLGLADLLREEAPDWQPFEQAASGWQAARQLLGDDPVEVLRGYIRRFV
jgi:hypothetical protein